MKRLVVPFSILLSLFSSCQGVSVRDKSPGEDYLAPEFSCKTGVIAYERKPEQLLIFEKYRTTLFRKPPENRKGVFAVITGDSTTALFHRQLLHDQLGEFEIYNRGIPGDTTVTFMDRMLRDVIPLHPEVIILDIGGNDILNGRCLTEVLENTELILSQFRNTLPDAHIILVSVPPVLTWKANSITPFYNRKLEYLAAKSDKIIYLDLWTHLAEKGTPVLDSRYHRVLPNGKKDRVHFNDEGYRVWAELLRPVLKMYQR